MAPRSLLTSATALLAALAVMAGLANAQKPLTGTPTECVQSYNLTNWAPANGPGRAYPPVYLCCNGVMAFSWLPTHNVHTFPTKEAFEACDFEAPGNMLLAASPQENSYSIVLGMAGTRWYGCSVQDHCADGGQKVEVNVAEC